MDDALDRLRGFAGPATLATARQLAQEHPAATPLLLKFVQQVAADATAALATAGPSAKRVKAEGDAAASLATAATAAPAPAVVEAPSEATLHFKLAPVGDGVCKTPRASLTPVIPRGAADGAVRGRHGQG